MKVKGVKGGDMPKYKIADVVFETNHIFEYTKKLCLDYLYMGKSAPSFCLSITVDDIEKEKQVYFEESLPDCAYEFSCLFRKLNEQLLENHLATVFHGSAVEVDGKGYIFTAPSGTGKSTHARLWKELLGYKLNYINDDKPILKEEDGKLYLYGSAWTGKHNLGSNIKVPLYAICKLNRGKVNKIKKADEKVILEAMLNQTFKPTTPKQAINLMGLIDKVIKSVKLFELDCDISIESAKLSFDTMSNGEENED